MSNVPPARAISCPTCGRLTLAGARGPLPKRCADCRRWPVRPERVAGQTTCSGCHGHLRVLGRRGRIPTVCPPCRGRRRAAANARRRLIPMTDRRYTPEELADFALRATWRR